MAGDGQRLAPGVVGEHTLGRIDRERLPGQGAVAVGVGGGAREGRTGQLAGGTIVVPGHRTGCLIGRRGAARRVPGEGVDARAAVVREEEVVGLVGEARPEGAIGAGDTADGMLGGDAGAQIHDQQVDRARAAHPVHVAADPDQVVDSLGGPRDGQLGGGHRRHVDRVVGGGAVLHDQVAGRVEVAGHRRGPGRIAARGPQVGHRAVVGDPEEVPLVGPCRRVDRVEVVVQGVIAHGVVGVAVGAANGRVHAGDRVQLVEQPAGHLKEPGGAGEGAAGGIGGGRRRHGQGQAGEQRDNSSGGGGDPVAGRTVKVHAGSLGVVQRSSRLAVESVEARNEVATTAGFPSRLHLPSRYRPPGRPDYPPAGSSAWPPNSRRIAESSRSAKSASPRELKRS